MTIIYGRLYQKAIDGEIAFHYIDEHGRSYGIQKLAWGKENYPNILQAMHQLSLDEWECFSITTKRTITGRLATTGYFKKRVKQ